MPDASFTQSDFRGGEWSAYAQGQIANPRYRTAMALCRNAYPVEEGACPRRPGFAFAATTRNGAQGRVMPDDFTDTASYTVELTDSHLRLFAGRRHVYTNDAAPSVIDISTANPAVVTLAQTVTWSTGDQVEFIFANADKTNDAVILRDRQFVITRINSQQFSLSDPITGATIDGSTIAYDPLAIDGQMMRILDLPTPYAADEIDAIRKVQAASVGPDRSAVSLLLHNRHQPQALEGLPNPAGPNVASFTLAQLDFEDGPYLDYPAGSIMTPDTTSGNITLTLSYQNYDSTVAYTLGEFVTSAGLDYESIVEVNLNHTPASSPTFWKQVNSGGAVGLNGFQQTDVNRSIRVFSEPAVWETGTSYNSGDAVKYDDSYYVAQNSNSGEPPPQNTKDWNLVYDSSVFRWCWGKIVSVTNSNTVVINLVDRQLLYVLPIFDWRLGAYSDTTGWPTCGCYHEGRLWLGGAIPNRFDASVSNDFFNMTPTDWDGTVADNNALSEVLDSEDEASIFWFEPTGQGIVIGTKAGEWLVQASQLNDPITPTSIQVHRNTKVGCANQIPAKTPLTLVVIHRFQRLLFEYFPDVFSGKLQAPNLNAFSKHLTTKDVEEIAYQSELAPILWARLGDGNIAGWTYRRQSAFATEEPTFVGGHSHRLGGGPLLAGGTASARVCESLCVVPDPDLTLDCAAIVSYAPAATDPQANVRHVEFSTPLLDPDSPLTSSWFLDDAVTPSGMEVATVNGVAGVYLFGLWHLNGEVASVVIAGLDCGDFLITNGQVFVPFQSDPGKLLTLAYLTALSNSGEDFGGLAVPLDQTATVTPPRAPSQGNVTVLQNATEGYLGPGNNPGGFYPDWRNNVAYFIPATSGNQITITKISLATKLEIARGTVTLTSDFFQGCLGRDGFFYAQSSVGDGGAIDKINLSTFTVVSTFGGSDPGHGGNPQSLANSGAMATVTGDANFLIVGSYTASQVQVLNVDKMEYAGHAFTTGSDSSIIVPGPSNPAGGTAMCAVLGYTFLDSGANTAFPLYTITFNAGAGALGATIWDSSTTYHAGDIVFRTTNTTYYEAIGTNTNEDPAGAGALFWFATTFDNPHISTLYRGDISVTLIDPGWTALNDPKYGVFDQTDGNLILAVSTQHRGTSANGAYIVKLRIADMKILWRVPVDFGMSNDVWRFGNVTGGILGVLSQTNNAGNTTCTVINTLDGTYSTFTVNGLTTLNGQVFDSTLGRLILYGNYSHTGANNNPIPGPLTPNSFSQWCVFTLGTVFFGAVTSTQRLNIPAVVGLNYLTQCQVVRPARPDETGVQTGPAQGMTKRSHMFGILLAGAIYGTLKVGTVFGKLRAIYFRSGGGADYRTDTLFTGVYQNTLEDDYSFDSQFCWEVDRPLPANVCSASVFLHGQGR